MDPNQPKDKTNRRRFLKTVGAAGVSLGIAGIASGTSDNEYVTIPTIKRDQEIVETAEVPLVWNTQREEAHQVVSNLQDTYGQVPEVGTISMTTADQEIDGLKFMKARVELHDQTVPISIPDNLDGIEVEIAEAEPAGEAGCLNHGRYNVISGGVVHRGQRFFGTTTCRVKKNGNFYMLTAAHLFGKCANIGGRKAWQDESTTRKYGNVHEWYNRHDWAAVRRNNNNGIRFDGRIKMPSGRKGVAGHITSHGLDHKMGLGTTMHKVGVSTGVKKGRILSTSTSTGAYDNPCVNMDGKGVRLSNDMADGDSGGPVFQLINGKCYMASIASLHVGSRIGTACGQKLFPKTDGWPAYKLANAGFKFYTGY